MAFPEFVKNHLNVLMGPLDQHDCTIPSCIAGFKYKQSTITR